MPKYTITDPQTGKSVDLEGDSPPTEAELNDIFSQVHGTSPEQAPTKSPGIIQTLGTAVQNADPTQLIKKAAPSNLLAMAGAASVNAPDVTSAVVNTLPGMGNPLKVLPAIQGVMSRPQQIPRALKRMGAIQEGGDPTKNEALPVLTGKLAGAAIEAVAQPNLSPSEMKAAGPFTAGLKNPGTALPGAFERAGEALGKAKVVARLGEDAGVAKQMRMMLQSPKGTRTLAEEGKALLEAGKDVSITKLLAYKEALGKMQAEGGTFANDYKLAGDLAKQLIAKKAPELAQSTENMAVNYLAKGNGPKFPWFTTALDPKVGVAKTATMPAVRNVVGAVLNPVVQAIPKVEAIGKIVKTLTEDKAREYLKKAKNVKEKAREMAIREGWKIPE